MEEDVQRKISGEKNYIFVLKNSKIRVGSKKLVRVKKLVFINVAMKYLYKILRIIY